MSAYFGNGYFLNILQRGAMPVGNAPSKLPPAPVRFEETVATTGNQPSEAASETFEVHNKSLDHPASIATQPPGADPLAESVTSKEPEPIEATTRFALRDVAEIPSGTTTRHSQDQETSATLRSDDSLEASESSLQVSPSPPLEPCVHKEPSVETPLRAQSTSQVFELRMPENFFGQATNETSSNNPVNPVPLEWVVSAPLSRQAESQPAGDHSSPAIPAKIHAEAQSQPNTVLIPKHRDELQPVEVTPPGPITHSQLKPQPASVVSEVMDHVKQNNVQPSRLTAPQAFESPTLTPRIEQSSDHLQLRQPSVATAPVVVPPARLRINRIDIQVVNQAPAPKPPPAQVPDVSQLLERHFGRVELLL